MTNQNATHEAIDSFELRLYKLTTRSHLRIGAGEGSIALSAADNPVIQALFYNPPNSGQGPGQDERVIYLPGSSLHGVIRAWAEKIHRSQNPFLTPNELETMIDRLDPNQKSSLLGQLKKEIEGFIGEKPADADVYNHWRVHSRVCDPLSLLDQCQRFGDAAEGQEVPAKKQWFNLLKAQGRDNPCPVCQVFGFVGQRGRVRIQHAYPAQGKLPLDVITRVAINRISGAADEGKLFDVEAVPPGAVFYFFAVLENMTSDQVRTFEAGIRALQLQFATLGAHSTVGFGIVEIDQVLRASLRQTEIFATADLPRQIQTILNDQQFRLHSAVRGLDSARYPSFYRALAMVDQQNRPSPIFAGQIDLEYGVG